MTRELYFNDENSGVFTVEHWLVGEGDQITVDQPLVTVRTKGNFYIVRSPIEGFLLLKKLFNGDHFGTGVSLGQVVDREEAGNIRIKDTLSRQERRILEQLHSKPQEANIRDKIHVKATPSARQAARQAGINIEDVQGSGPDGRVQLKDINTYLENLKNKENQTDQVEIKVVYGLPPTLLARKLAKKYNLDIRKVPAPPGAVRLRKKDVERFLRSPESAEAILLKDYQTVEEEKPNREIQGIPLLAATNAPSLPEPNEVAKNIIKLPTEAVSHAPSDGVILLDQKIKIDTKALGGPANLLALAEPNDKNQPVIRLTTDIPLSQMSGDVIELNQVYKVDLLKLMEPDSYYALTEPKPQGPIKLPTEEESLIPSGETIALTEEEKPKALMPPNNDELLARFISGELLREKDLKTLLEDDAIKNLLKLSTGNHSELNVLATSEPPRVLTFSDEIELPETIKKVLNIDSITVENRELRLFIIAAVNRAIRKALYKDRQWHGSLLIQGLKNRIPIKIVGQKESYLEKEIPLRAGLIDNINILPGEVYIVDLLKYYLTGVSGIIDPKEHPVVYITALDADTIGIDFSFSTEQLSEETGLDLIEAIRNEFSGEEIYE